MQLWWMIRGVVSSVLESQHSSDVNLEALLVLRNLLTPSVVYTCFYGLIRGLWCIIFPTEGGREGGGKRTYPFGTQTKGDVTCNKTIEKYAISEQKQMRVHM